MREERDCHNLGCLPSGGIAARSEVGPVKRRDAKLPWPTAGITIDSVMYMQSLNIRVEGTTRCDIRESLLIWWNYVTETSRDRDHLSCLPTRGVVAWPVVRAVVGRVAWLGPPCLWVDPTARVAINGLVSIHSLYV